MSSFSMTAPGLTHRDLVSDKLEEMTLEYPSYSWKNHLVENDSKAMKKEVEKLVG